MGKKNQSKSDQNGDIDGILEEIEGTKKEENVKKSKKVKTRKDSDENIAEEMDKLSLKEEGKLKEKKETHKKKKKEKSLEAANSDSGDEDFQPTVGGGFAALMNDDDDNDIDDEILENIPSENIRQKEKKVASKEENKKKTKKSKAKKKGRDDDEDDIDQILAELESEYTGVPLEKTKKEENEKVINDESVKKEESVERRGSKEDVKDTKKVSTEVPPQETVSKKDKKKTKKVEEKLENDEMKKEITIDEKKKKLPSEDKIEEKKDEDKLKEDNEKVEGEKTKTKNKKATKETAVKKPEKKEATSSEKETPVEDASKKKKKKTKEELKKEEEDAKARKGKPNKKMLAAMKEMLEKKKEEEERRRKEEEQREREEEERIRKLEEQRRLEEERKERQKQKQKERIKRLKEEGKLLTAKQKLEQKRAQLMLEHLKAQGIAIPEAGEKIAPITYKKTKKKKPDEVPKEDVEEKQEEDASIDIEEEKKEEEIQEEVAQEEEEEDDGVADAWDALSSDSEQEDSTENKENVVEEQGECSNEEEESEESDEEEHQTEAQKRRERAIARMEQRRISNEKNRSENTLRSPVVCVLGHVDHGKTKILDKLRKTNVQEGEVGGITQQIGATNVPFDAVISQTRMVKDFDPEKIRLPGLLIIDTPGHESFSNLRSRGSSLCDIAILVVDITQGLEPQTIESINLLKNKKTPFIIALNKVDRVFEWESHPSKDIREIIKLQNNPCKNDFDRRSKEVIQALNIQGLNAALFWENPDPRTYVSLVPTSAISGDGMGNLMSLITTMCQLRLSNRLMLSEELQCTVLEVKTIQGHGTTIDVILINGRLREGDTIVLAGTEGPIVTQIRSLLIPKPMKEIRVKGQYDELKVVEAALGVKIAARELEKAIAGLNLQVAYHEDEVDLLKEEVDKEFKNAMRSIKVRDKGVYVQASTLGALEALLEFFKANKVPYAGIRVGPVVKRDVMKAAAMLEHDPMYAVILAFDVKVERDAQELADKEGIKIFSEETIYHLGDRYVEYIKEYKKKKQDEFKHVAVFPSKLKIIPTAIFNKRDPIVLGVTVDSGILRTGTPLCVPSKEFVEIGVVTSLEFDHKTVEIAKKGVDVCIKIEPLPGHTPKLFGRHFLTEDILVSKISRESIDACKQYFRDDLGKNEWKLMAELKKQFNIL